MQTICAHNHSCTLCSIMRSGLQSSDGTELAESQASHHIPTASPSSSSGAVMATIATMQTVESSGLSRSFYSSQVRVDVPRSSRDSESRRYGCLHHGGSAEMSEMLYVSFIATFFSRHNQYFSDHCYRPRAPQGGD